MGQKVNPLLIRLGINPNATWKAQWFATPKDYAKKVQMDLAIRSYLEKSMKSAGVSSINIAFTTKEAKGLANITVHVARSGVVIGKKGGGVERIKKELEALLNMPVYLSIQEVRRPELDAKLVAENITGQLLRRINHRRAIKRAQDTTMHLGALGIKVIISGRLGGTEIARRETYQKGSVPLHTFSKTVDYAQATAQTSSGKIGIIVYIHTKLNAQKEFVGPSRPSSLGGRKLRGDRGRPRDNSKRYVPRDHKTKQVN